MEKPILQSVSIKKILSIAKFKNSKHFLQFHGNPDQQKPLEIQMNRESTEIPNDQ